MQNQAGRLGRLPAARACANVAGMRVLFLQPPMRDCYRTAFREYPLGLMSLAAAVRREGSEVVLLDARRAQRGMSVAPPTEIAQLLAPVDGAEPLLGPWRHFGFSFARIEREVAAIAPDVVCVSAMCTPYAGEAIETARAVRRAQPTARIIMGGHHATADPESLVAEGVVDHVVRGEGEEILPQIIAGDGFPQIVEAPDGKPLRITDLDALAQPARDLVDAGRYRYGRRRYAMVVTSRGCPHCCRFCSVHALSGHAHRARSIAGVLAEIEELVDGFGVTAIDFQDDNLLFDRDRIQRLCEALLKRFGSSRIEWMASNGLNVAHLDGELLRLMRRAGFAKLDIAIGTGAVPSRATLARPEELEQYERVRKAAVRLGFRVATYIILGLPWQRYAEMEATADALMAQGIFIAPSAFYNVPGMPIFEAMQRFEYVHAHVARRSSLFNAFGEDFQREDVMRLFARILAHNRSLRG